MCFLSGIPELEVLTRILSVTEVELKKTMDKQTKHQKTDSEKKIQPSTS